MHRAFDEIERRVVRKLLFQKIDFRARFFLFAARQINQNHQDARFRDVRVIHKRLAESGFGVSVIFGVAHSLKNAVGVTRAQTAVSKRKMRVKLDGAAEIGDCGFAVFHRDSAENKASEIVAPAQKFFVSFGVFRRTPTEASEFFRRKLKLQAFENALSNHVLKRENVVAFRIDAVAPENVARQNVEQLRRDAHFVSRTHKARRQNGVNAQFAPGFARVNVRALIFGNHGRRAHDERFQLRQLGNHGVSQRKFIELRVGVAA